MRRDIVRAYKFEKGGLRSHYVNPLGMKPINGKQDFPTRKLKARELSEILSEVLEIEVKEVDVTNDRKSKVFVPNQVPRTPKVIEKLYQLQSKVFPQLNPKEFLTPTCGYKIDSCDLNECIHSQKMYQN